MSRSALKYFGLKSTKFFTLDNFVSYGCNFGFLARFLILVSGETSLGDDLRPFLTWRHVDFYGFGQVIVLNNQSEIAF